VSGLYKDSVRTAQ